ncbi:MAG: rod shape-determining protein MreC [Sterolibacterium sp.]|nr:rod shape-determining protein MreC [Sterolibacterium sp.]
MISVVGHQPPPFFHRGPAPFARLMFFVALSLLLLVLDLRFHTLELARQGVALVTYPLQRLANAPLEGLESWGNYFSSLVTLEKENTGLRRQQLTTANLLLRQEHLELENQRLRALLDMKARQPVTSQVAEILYAARDPFARRVILDKGMQHDIATGQVVIDELGVIGQVTRVFPMLSEVTLITDKDQAVPVMIVRNGLRSVLFGAGAGNLELRFLAANADVQAGDVLVTSGLDEVYLPGLPVAKVTRVDRDTSYAFARILCEPIPGVERNGQVLVLGRREALPPAPPELESKDKPSKGRKGAK